MPVVLARKKLTFDSSSCRLLRVALLARPAITFHNNIFTSTASFRTTVEATRRLRLTHTRSQKRCRTRRGKRSLLAYRTYLTPFLSWLASQRSPLLHESTPLLPQWQYFQADKDAGTSGGTDRSVHAVRQERRSTPNART